MGVSLDPDLEEDFLLDWPSFRTSSLAVALFRGERLLAFDCFLGVDFLGALDLIGEQFLDGAFEADFVADDLDRPPVKSTPGTAPGTNAPDALFFFVPTGILLAPDSSRATSLEGLLLFLAPLGRPLFFVCVSSWGS